MRGFYYLQLRLVWVHSMQQISFTTNSFQIFSLEIYFLTCAHIYWEWDSFCLSLTVTHGLALIREGRIHLILYDVWLVPILGKIQWNEPHVIEIEGIPTCDIFGFYFIFFMGLCELAIPKKSASLCVHACVIKKLSEIILAKVKVFCWSGILFISLFSQSFYPCFVLTLTIWLGFISGFQ